MKEDFDLKKAQEIIIEWAKPKNYITKVYIFGSRVTGFSKKTGQPVRPDSDLDVAVELGNFDENQTCRGIWTGQQDKWRKELSEKLNLGEEVKLSLNHYDYMCNLYDDFKNSSELIYERDATH